MRRPSSWVRGMLLRSGGLLLLLLLLTAYMTHSYRKETALIAQQHTSVLQVAYHSVVNMHRLDMRTRLQTQVFTPYQAQLLLQLQQADEAEQPRLRGLLYRSLHAVYQELKAQGLRQLQFHGADGSSLLRMQRPELSGDDLLEVRPSVRIALQERRAVSGFEGGRIGPGFRTVFPLELGGELLGSVEFSMPFEQIESDLRALLPAMDFMLLMRRQVSDVTIFTPQDEQFVTSSLHDAFVEEHPHYSRLTRAAQTSERVQRLLPQLQQDVVIKRMLAGESFSVPLIVDGQGYVISLLAIVDAEQQPSGHVLAFSEVPLLLSMRQEYLWQFALSAGLLVLALQLFRRLQLSRSSLKSERNQLRAITDSMGEGLYVLDTQGRALLINPAACRLLEYEASELIGRKVHFIFHSHAHNQQLSQAECPIFRTTLGGQAYQGQELFTRRSGEVFVADVHSRPLLERGRLVGSVTVFSDISVEKAEADHRRLLTSALEAVANGVVITDTEAQIEWVNPAFERLTGYSLEEARGKKPSDLIKSGRQSPEYYDAMWKCIKAGEIWQGEVVNRHKDGSFYHEELTIAPVLDETGQIRHFVGVKQDITERKETEERIRHLAQHDTLTNLPNRELFNDRLRTAMKLARRERYTLAVMFIDLDRFKPVNDTHGHDVGDLLLKEVAERIRHGLRASDTAARIGGDEFVVLLHRVESAQAATGVAQKIQQALREPFVIRDLTLDISSSIGMAFYPLHTDDPFQLLKLADQAMYHAKHSGRDRISLYQPDENA